MAMDQEHEETTGQEEIREPRLWQVDGWTARVIKNEDDDGWAVAMTQAGHVEPALVGPWTMGRDKKNPKPLDTAAFNTLVKTAYEVVRRAEQHLQATLHRQFDIETDNGRITVMLDIEPDEDHPSATLSAQDAAGESLASIKVSPGFVLNRASAQRWIEADFAKPR